MAPHYEVFYSLENSIRAVISDLMNETYGPAWWIAKDSIPEIIKNAVKDRVQKEIDSGTTRRSSQPLDFTTFGELSEIIKTNWGAFGGMFTSVKAVEKVMNSLNVLRAPIAHCSPLAEDEILRLQISVKDWFRLME
jgi:Swt1-like HEPN